MLKGRIACWGNRLGYLFISFRWLRGALFSSQTSPVNITNVLAFFCIVSPVTRTLVNIGTTAFVDDTGSTLTRDHHLLLSNFSKQDDFTFDKRINPLGVVQNLKKQEFICRTFGQGTRAFMWKLQQNNDGFRTSTRYLGPHLQWNGSVTPEIERRIEAPDKAWYI